MALTKEEYEAAFNEGYEEATAWKPIETAPKDESAILVYCPAKIVTIITAAFWHKDYSEWRMAFTGLTNPPQRMAPTHWQPLPPAPTAGQE